jgi:putative CocE/NonD family hydrolase
MRDGVKLATDVYVPSARGRYPVLVTRSPYNKNGERRRAMFFAQHGYVFVAQDCRGTYASEGVLYPLIHEDRDGYDTIEWAAAQPWSNGKVGTTGASYLAMDQYAAAILRPPHLVAMYAAVGSQNYYEDSGYPGGIPTLGWPVWILLSAASDRKADAATRDRLQALVKQPEPWLRDSRESRAKVFDNFPAQKRVYDDFYAHPTFDAYWKQPGFDTADYYDRIKDVPVLFLSGWYDSFADATIRNYVALARIQKTEKRLIMGPWPHGYGKSLCGDAEFGPQANLDENALMLDWFDNVIKGQPLRVLGPEPVRYFRMGGKGGRDSNGHLTPGGEWKATAAWPPAGQTHPLRLYLRDPGVLASTAPVGEAPNIYRYNPSDPVHTNGGRHGAECIQNQTLQRPDILSFSSQPLLTDLEATGTPSAALWVATNGPSTDFIAKLIDVYPDGYAAILLEEGVRVNRHGREPQQLTVDLGTTSNLFARGHRIRLDVASSSFPKLEPNPHAATNSIFHDAKHPSYLELPVRELQ